jgi:V/A-type H+-transporting ATPase subunit D
MSFMNVKPTRPELDMLKKKRNFYTKGEKLLEIKREQLLNSLKPVLVNYFKQRKILRDQILEDFRYLQGAYENIGKQKIVMISALNKLHFKTDIDVTFFTRIGVDVPKITLKLSEGKLPSYSFSDMPMHIDFLSQKLKQTLEDMLKLAEFDSLLYNLATNFKRIERRINALDDIILPKLDTAIFQIDEILEDMSQEEFIRMKKIKEHLETLTAKENEQ